MYLKLFHAFKKVKGRFFKRAIGLARYIVDYKIILHSIEYLIANEVMSRVLRLTLEGELMGLLRNLGMVIIGLIIVKIWRKEKTEKKFARKAQGGGQGKENTKFVLLVSVVTTMIFAGLRNTPRFLNENEVKRIAPSFTNSSTENWIYIAREVGEKHTRLEVIAQPLQDFEVNGQKLKKSSSLLLLKLPTFYNFEIGQVCKIFGSFDQPENFDEFDYRGYLRNQKIFFIMDRPIVECRPVSNSRAGSQIRNKLVDLKNRLIKKVDSVLNEPQSSLLVGILFGQKRLFSNTFDDATRMGGVSHIVAASGYNITVLTIIVNRLFSFLPKRLRLIVSFLTIWSFAILSGLSASIVRACIMSSISILALLFGRNNSIHVLLPFTSFLFIFISPTALSNVGFLLSMSAVLGLVYVLPILTNFRKKILCKLKFLDSFVLPTLSCTLTTLPISIIVFKTFSIWSVPVNAILLPVLESTMLFGFLAILSQSIFPALSYFFYSVVNVQLLYFEKVVMFVKKLNFGQVTLSDNFSLLVGLIVLVVIIFFSIYFYPIKNEQHNHYLKDS